MDLMATRRPAEVFPPGEFLREELEARGWSQADFAEILGRPPRLVNEIVMGKRAVTPETAKGLAAALGTSPEVWLRLEAAYQLWRTPGDGHTESVMRRARMFSFAPVRDLARRGWIEWSENIDVLEQRLLDFYETDSVEARPQFRAYAARKSTPYETESAAQTAWLYRARNLARTVRVERYARERLDAAVAQLCSLLRTPEDIGHVPSIVGDAGIRLVLLEALPGSKIDGASFWLNDTEPVIVLSLRFDRIDYVWHTLMHEIAHIHHGDVLSVDVFEDVQGESKAERPKAEQEADAFAVEQLVPQQKLEEFITQVRPHYSSARIEAFATMCGVHPGIVVGQLQHRGEIPWANLRRLLAPVRNMLTTRALTDGWGARLPSQI